MFCPKCKAEYREGFLTCSDCNVNLVEVLPSESIQEPEGQVAAGEKPTTERPYNEILEELRRQTACYRRICKINAIGFSILGILIIAFLVSTIPTVRTHLLPSSIPSIPLSTPESWTEARDLLGRGDLYGGIEMTQKLIKKYPQYYYGYALLASAYQQSGDWKEAEENCAKAYELFPTEENGNTLRAIREAMEKTQKGSKIFHPGTNAARAMVMPITAHFWFPVESAYETWTWGIGPRDVCEYSWTVKVATDAAQYHLAYKIFNFQPGKRTGTLSDVVASGQTDLWHYDPKKKSAALIQQVRHLRARAKDGGLLLELTDKE
jgi:tetratricopeptide (TPR) repeat protein